MAGVQQSYSTVLGRDAGVAMLVLLVAFLGGALLNFTPCVLPVIPLKIMALSAAAGDRRRRRPRPRGVPPAEGHGADDADGDATKEIGQTNNNAGCEASVA